VPGTNKKVPVNDQIRFFPLTIEMIWNDYVARYDYERDQSSLSQYLDLSQKVQPATILLGNLQFMTKMQNYLFENYIREGASSLCADQYGGYGTSFDAGKLIFISNTNYQLFDCLTISAYSYYVTDNMTSEMKLRFPVRDESRLHAYRPGMWVCFELIKESLAEPSGMGSTPLSQTSSDNASFEGFPSSADQPAASPSSPGSARCLEIGDDVMENQVDVEADVSNNPKAFQRRKFCHCNHTLLKYQYPSYIDNDVNSSERLSRRVCGKLGWLRDPYVCKEQV